MLFPLSYGGIGWPVPLRLARLPGWSVPPAGKKTPLDTRQLHPKVKAVVFLRARGQSGRNILKSNFAAAPATRRRPGRANCATTPLCHDVAGNGQRCDFGQRGVNVILAILERDAMVARE